MASPRDKSWLPSMIASGAATEAQVDPDACPASPESGPIRSDESRPTSPMARLAPTQTGALSQSFSSRPGHGSTRTSSFSERIDTLRRVGGVNSIDGFARSWQRAAGFYEIAPSRRPSMTFSDAGHEYRRRDEESGVTERTSLLRQQLERADSHITGAVDDVITETSDEEETDEQDDGLRAGRRRRSTKLPSHPKEDDIFAVAPHLAAPTGSNYGTSYGSLISRVNESSMKNANRLWREQQETGVQEPDKEREPLLVKRVEREDGHFVNVVVGQSTLPQTVFNAVNVLIGVGLLSLPLGIKYSGWLIGMIFLAYSALVTAYTARLLAKCLDVDDSLITFADIAYVAFGPRARVIVSILFSIELIAACVALVVLFADSLETLLPFWSTLEWKLFCGLLLIPIGFVPLRILSFSSILGIFSTLSIVCIVFIDGLIKPDTPGSLRNPAKTYLLPENWFTLPLSLGLLMSPWGGHSVFPNIYRDMRHPYKYRKGVTITYVSTYLLDLSMAVAGLMMFGDEVLDEITKNILKTAAYPRALSIAMIAFIAIIPLTKIPLNARPIVSTIEIYSGLDARAVAAAPSLIGMSGMTRGILKITIRVIVPIVLCIFAVVFPDFDRIMALLGSAMCFSICVILPIAFHLKIFGRDIPFWERMLNWLLMAVSTVMALVGTVWAFLPPDMIGAK